MFTGILCFNDEYHCDAICKFFELKVVGDPNEANAHVVFDRNNMPIRPEVFLEKLNPGEWRQKSLHITSLRGKMTR